MSYSLDVKNELARCIEDDINICRSELIGIISMIGNIKVSEDDKISLSISTEHSRLARKYFTLLKKTYNISTDIVISKNTFLNKNHSYSIILKNDADVRRILTDMGLLDEFDNLLDDINISMISDKRAFLRGIFLSSGFISDPEKAYHLEIVCQSLERAQQLRDIILVLVPKAKIVKRKKAYIIYLKESDRIVDFLGWIGAHNALMDLENIRILKSMRNDVNRKVNCEMANINKTVSASLKQIEDISFIRDSVGFDVLNDNLREMAVIRLAHPQASLKELGSLLSAAVGKSGVNHRLRKLSEFANELRDKL